MKNPFTLDDLILSNYCETHNSDEMKISDLIKLDVDLRQGLDNQNDNCSVSPDKRIVSNILCYSRALCVFSTKRAGNINILLN